MAAPSFWVADSARTNKSGGLDYSKPPQVVWACQKGCCTTAFFLCRRPAGTYFITMQSLIFQVHGTKSLL